MEQKEFKKLKVGDKVQIVSLKKLKRCAARNRVMDKWAWKIVTVRASKFEGVAIKIEEDKTENYGDGWFWVSDMIERKVNSASEYTTYREACEQAIKAGYTEIANASGKFITFELDKIVFSRTWQLNDKEYKFINDEHPRIEQIGISFAVRKTPQPQFKVGDRVKCIGHQVFNELGKVGTIIGFCNDDDVVVEFDKDVGGHTGFGYGNRIRGKQGHCVWKDKRNLELVHETPLVYLNQKIVITTDGTTVLARMYEGKKVVKTATAKCNPKDTYDFAKGAKIAFDRLFEK